MKYRATTFPIANEAWLFAVPLLVAMVLSFIFDMNGFAIFLLIALIYVLAFFRNPQRNATANPYAIICPADGKIVSAGIISHPDFEGGQALRIAIFMNVFNVHVNWSPVSGTVKDALYYSGKFLNAMEDKCAEENERKLLWVDTPGAGTVIVKLVAGLVARRVVCPIEPGDAVERGEKIGLIRFGSRVEVILPVSCSLQVEPGMIVRGGETVVAFLPRPEGQVNYSEATAKEAAAPA